MIQRVWYWIRINRADLSRVATAVLACILLISFINQMIEIRQQTERIQAVQKQQSQILDQQSQILQQLKDSTSELKADTAEQFKKQQEFDLCIVKFFGRTDRASLKIENICTITSSGLPSSSPSTSSPAPAPANTNSTPASGSTDKKKDQPAPTPPAPQKVTVLGVPICVPLTKLCIVR